MQCGRRRRRVDYQDVVQCPATIVTRLLLGDRYVLLPLETDGLLSSSRWQIHNVQRRFWKIRRTERTQLASEFSQTSTSLHNLKTDDYSPFEEQIVVVPRFVCVLFGERAKVSSCWSHLICSSSIHCVQLFREYDRTIGSSFADGLQSPTPV